MALTTAGAGRSGVDSQVKPGRDYKAQTSPNRNALANIGEQLSWETGAQNHGATMRLLIGFIGFGKAAEFRWLSVK